jgi:hypothetical protein
MAVALVTQHAQEARGIADRALADLPWRHVRDRHAPYRHRLHVERICTVVASSRASHNAHGPLDRNASLLFLAHRRLKSQYKPPSSPAAIFIHWYCAFANCRSERNVRSLRGQ